MTARGTHDCRSNIKMKSLVRGYIWAAKSFLAYEALKVLYTFSLSLYGNTYKPWEDTAQTGCMIKRQFITVIVFQCMYSLLLSLLCLLPSGIL